MCVCVCVCERRCTQLLKCDLQLKHYILMDKAAIQSFMGMKTNKKVYFVYAVEITIVKVTILLVTIVNFWHSMLQFIYIPYILRDQDWDRWWALLNVVINL